MTTNDIYQRQELLDIYKDPSNKGKIEPSDAHVHETNPLCGDVIDLYLSIDGGIITDAKFDGDACAVSIISSSLVTEEIIGKPLEYAKKLSKKDVLEFIGVDLTTSRIKCATLVVEALQKAILKYEQSKRY
jgi:nitrogen fixation protein NifU and related proteins